MSRIIEELDVICQFKSDGEILPIKFRFMNEDGYYKEYKVSGYRKIQINSVHTTDDGITIGPNDKLYRCRVIDDGRILEVRMYFSVNQCKWRLAI